MSKRPLLTIIIAFLLIFNCAVLSVAKENTLADLDHLYAQRAQSPGIVDQLRRTIESELKEKPGSYELLWRMARVYMYMGDNAGSSGEKLRLYEQGKEYAEKAVAANQEGYEGYYYLGVLIGSVGQERGIMNSLFMVNPMKNALERCLAIDPERALAYNPLAQLYWKAPGRPLSIGNIKTALELAEKLVALSPDSVYDWYIYGCIAYDAKKPDLARKALEKALSLPEDPEDPLEDRKTKESARELLAKLGRK